MINYQFRTNLSTKYNKPQSTYLCQSKKLFPMSIRYRFSEASPADLSQGFQLFYVILAPCSLISFLRTFSSTYLTIRCPAYMTSLSIFCMTPLQYFLSCICASMTILRMCTIFNGCALFGPLHTSGLKNAGNLRERYYDSSSKLFAPIRPSKNITPIQTKSKPYLFIPNPLS